jgi:MATE family multidrug resistance protein
LFSDEENLVDLVSENIGLMGLVVILHGMSMILGGTMRGLGMQKIAIWVVLGAFYGIAFPCSFIFGIILDL